MPKLLTKSVAEEQQKLEKYSTVDRIAIFAAAGVVSPSSASRRFSRKPKARTSTR